MKTVNDKEDSAGCLVEAICTRLIKETVIGDPNICQEEFDRISSIIREEINANDNQQVPLSDSSAG